MVMVLAAALTAAGFHAHSYEASYAEDRDEGSEKILPEGPWGSFRGTKDQETRVYDDDYRSSSSWGPTLGWFFALASSFFWAAALVSFYQAWNKDQLGLAQGQNVNVIKGGTTGPRQEPQPRQQAYHGQSDFGAPRPRRVEKDRSVDRVERFSSYGGSSKAAPPPPQAPPTPPWQAQQPNYQWQPKSLVRKTRPRRGQGMDQPWSCQGCGSWQPGELMFCGSCRRRRGE
jgi:hypothetical protein